MKTHTTASGQQYAVVPVPKGTKWAKIYTRGDGSGVLFYHRDGGQAIDLPDGYEYEHLFQLSQATEQQAAEVVETFEFMHDDETVTGYVDYTGEWHFDNAIDSIASLCRSLHPEHDGDYLILKIG